MENDEYMYLKMGEKGAIISIIAYICLSATKIIIGFMANSEALKADGLNNLTDIIASIVVLIGLRLSQKPADKDHPYGHWRAETVASMISSFIMMTVGIQVFIDAFSTIITEKSETPDPLSALTGLLCATVIYFVYRYNRKLAKKTNSQAVMAAAKDNLSDAWVSAGTTVGIIGAQFHLPWLDSVTAVIIGLLICKTAWDIFRDSSHNLTDGFNDKEIQTFQKTIQEIHGVKGVKDIKARSYGNNTVVDIVILVNSNLNIRDAHDVSTKVENILIEKHHVFDVNVHVEPN